MKHHSFLTKWVVAVMPRKDKALLQKLSAEIVKSLSDVIDNGFTVNGEKYFVGLIGLKGDEKWFQKIACLTRSHASQIALNTKMCRECEAGEEDMPLPLKMDLMHLSGQGQSFPHGLSAFRRFGVI